MNRSTIRKTLLALLVAASMPAMASDYFVVVPVPNKKISVDAITVSLAAYTAPVGQVGFAYAGLDLRTALSVKGDPGYTGFGVKWLITGGSLPPGLTLNSNGTVTGTPTAAGTSMFSVRASYKTKTGDQQYQILTYRIDVGLAAGTPPQAQVGQAYSYSLSNLLTVKGDPNFTGTGVTWTTVSSSLPAGLYLTSDGWIGGTPTAAGTGSITARATYKGVNGQQSYQVVSLNIAVALAPSTLPQAILGQSYSYNLASLLSVNGDAGYSGSGVTWSVTSGSLPAGLSLGADGTISGTPTAGGTGSFTARATYRGVNGEQAYQVVSLNIAVGLAQSTPPQALVGQAYSYSLASLLTVSGDAAYNGSGVTWSVVSSSLPAGLYLTNDGWIGGTPSAGGTGSITARATYKGVNGQQSYQVVSLAITVALAASTLPQAVIGQAYSYNLASLLSVAGDAGYHGSGVTWDVASGSLPAGLTLGTDGTIIGTPTASGTGSFTARASYKGVNGQQAYQVVTLNIAVGLAQGTPPQAVVGQAYSYSLASLLTVSGDAGYDGSGVTWSVVSSTLPSGLSMTSDGLITGTPTAAGTGAITARASYKGVNGQQTYQVVSLNISVSLAAGTPPQAIVGQAYSYNVASLLTVNGDSGYSGSGVTWSTVSSSLPTGLALGSNGVITGTPSAAGTGTITARASYKGVNGQQTYQVVSLNISVSLAAGTPPQAIVGQAYSYNVASLLTVSGDSGYTGTGVTWSTVSSSLPAGLSLSAAGQITGTPTAAGTGSITARASYRNVAGQQSYQVVTLNISVTLGNATMPVAVTGNSYGSYDFKAFLTVSGDPAYTSGAATWSLVSGSVPAGMSVSSNGVLTGTPSVAGTSNFTLRAAYRGQSAQHAYALQVDAASVPGQLTADSGTDFGTFGIGGATTRSFTFVNNGNTAATGLFASASGTGYGLWSSTCGSPGAPVTLAKGASCNFTVRFSPSTPALQSGTVAVNWSGPTASGKALTVTGTTTVDYSFLMGGFGNANVAIGTNVAWAAGMQWYWLSANADQGAAVGTYEFRRTIFVGGNQPISAYFYGAVDDVIAAVAVNGVQVYGGLSMPFSSYNASPAFTLQPGTNVIAVQITNGAGPAGMALRVYTGGTMLTNESGWMHQ
jgi:hypothetical protein